MNPEPDGVVQHIESLRAALPAVVLLAIIASVFRLSGRRRIARRRFGCDERRGPKTRIVGARHLVRAAGAQLFHRRLRRPASRPERLPVVLGDIARGCSSGQSLTASFVANVTAPADSDPLFARTIVALQAGDTIGDALECERPSDPDQLLAIHVLRLCAAQGGNVSESLDRAAATLRERQAGRLERVSQASQARLSAKVLTVLPLAFATWTLLTTPSVQQFIVTPVGVTCVVFGVILNLTGWTLMNHVIRGQP